MKHCELEGHLHGDTAEGGIGPSSVSFISKTRGRISCFCGFSSVPTEVHHYLKLCFCGTKSPCLYVYVCETKPYRHTLPLYSSNSFSQNWSYCFFPIFLAAFSWVGLLPRSTVWQHSWWWAMGQGHISSGVSRECCQDFVVNLQPHPCLSSCLSVCPRSQPGLWNAAKSTSVEGVVTSSRGHGGCRN